MGGDDLRSIGMNIIDMNSVPLLVVARPTDTVSMTHSYRN